jgi:hypothetical protein
VRRGATAAAEWAVFLCRLCLCVCVFCVCVCVCVDGEQMTIGMFLIMFRCVRGARASVQVMAA